MEKSLKSLEASQSCRCCPLMWHKNKLHMPNTWDNFALCVPSLNNSFYSISSWKVVITGFYLVWCKCKKNTGFLVLCFKPKTGACKGGSVLKWLSTGCVVTFFLSRGCRLEKAEPRKSSVICFFFLIRSLIVCSLRSIIFFLVFNKLVSEFGWCLRWDQLRVRSKDSLGKMISMFGEWGWKLFCFNKERKMHWRMNRRNRT